MIAIETSIGVGVVLLSLALASHAAMYSLAPRKGYAASEERLRLRDSAYDGARITAVRRVAAEKSLAIEARRRILNQAVINAARPDAGSSEEAEEVDVAVELREQLASVDSPAVHGITTEDRDVARSIAGSPDGAATRRSWLVPLIFAGAAVVVLCSPLAAVAASQMG